MNVLAIDAGSSSLKLAAYDMPAERLLMASNVAIEGSAGELKRFVSALRAQGLAIDAVAHRFVFGGPQHERPQRITPALVDELEGYVQLHPVHLRLELDAFREARDLVADAEHLACFDTAFHARMPMVAQRYPLGPEFGDVRRYGYHGLSYEYVVSVLPRSGRHVIAHLGNGASMAAVRDGEPLDTTMGFSPLGGTMMGTRPGDLDPGVLLFALDRFGYDGAKLRQLLTERSGLLAVSGSTADMRELLAREAHDEAAAQAIELFVYLAAKQIGALAAVLGGVDRLIFTGGIGEGAREIRERICARAAYLGAEVLVVPTNEALAMCRHALAFERK